MAKGIRALLDTVMQALPQVGNLGLLFFLLFFIFAALGVELFGRLECNEDTPCEGLGEHAHFKDFGMAFLTLFRVATGDNWNGIMKDTLRDNCDYSSDCIKNCCISPIIAPLYFVIFVLMAQFVLVNVVVAVLMKHLEESHKQMDDDLAIDAELERELAEEMQLEKLAEIKKSVDASCKTKGNKAQLKPHKPLVKMASLPPNFVFPFNSEDRGYQHGSLNAQTSRTNTTDCVFSNICDLPNLTPNFTFTPPPPSVSFLNKSNVNIRQASPDESESKVSVANLSPVPFRSTLSVPCTALSNQPSLTNSINCDSELKKTDESSVSQNQNPQVDDWSCVFQSMNTDPHKVHFLPVLQKDVIDRTNLCNNKSLAVNENKNIPDSFFLIQSPNECDSGCDLTDPNVTDQSTSVGSLQTATFLSPSLLDVENFQKNHAPLIIRRLKRKVMNLEGQSSISSDVPEDSKHKNFPTDLPSLEC